MNGKRKWLGLLTVFGVLLSLLFAGIVDAGCLSLFGGRQARRAARRSSYSVSYNSGGYGYSNGYGNCAGGGYALQSVQAPAKYGNIQAPMPTPAQAPTRYGQAPYLRQQYQQQAAPYNEKPAGGLGSGGPNPPVDYPQRTTTQENRLPPSNAPPPAGNTLPQ